MPTPRDATEDDREALATFTCCGSDAPSWELDAQEMVRSEALDWLTAHPANRRVWIFEEQGEILAITAFDVSDLSAVEIKVTAVALANRQKGLGRMIVRNVLAYCADRGASDVYTDVHEGNIGSIRVCRSVVGDLVRSKRIRGRLIRFHWPL